MPTFREYVDGYYSKVLKVDYDFSRFCDLVESRDKNAIEAEWRKFNEIYIDKSRQNYNHYNLFKRHLSDEFLNDRLTLSYV